MPDGSIDATRILSDHTAGDPAAASQLLPLVYRELRALAADYLRRERPEHSLQATALVHEAYLRLVDITRVDWRGKSHFFAMAARQMRRVLVEHARRRNARKRGGDLLKVSLDEAVTVVPGPDSDVLALHDALETLARLSPRQGEIAMLRFFGGLSEKETGYVLGVSERTVRADWRVARAWLRRELTGSGSAA